MILAASRQFSHRDRGHALSSLLGNNRMDEVSPVVFSVAIGTRSFGSDT